MAAASKGNGKPAPDPSGARPAHVHALLAQAREALRDSDSPSFAETEGSAELAVQAAADALRAAVDASAQTPEKALELARLAMELQVAANELRQRALRRRIDGLSAIQTALGELRTIGSVEEMLERATIVLCQRCGFDRASLLRIEGSEAVLASAFAEGDPGLLVRLQKIIEATGSIQLQHRLLETDMVRRRMPILVRDVQNDGRTASPIPPIRVPGGPSSYVAAPVMPEGRVIGVLHADVHRSGREADVIDRDILWAFAEGYGYALERTLLVGRLRTTWKRMRELMHDAESDLTDTALQLARAEHGEDAVASAATVLIARSDSHHDRLASLLTNRELEVLEMMAQGATNRQIASQFVISEGTVKSHVRNVLRKLHSANRSEAVSRYFRMMSHQSD
jgi:ATP/maltotriose-dependent transcriptional regulator MalT